MSQRIESERFPYLPLRVDLDGLELRLDALIDTGFDGDVAVPPELMERARSEAFEVYVLADGSQARVTLYEGSARIGEFPPVIVEVIALGGEPIIGRGLTDRYAVLLDRGRRVVVEP